MDLVEVWKDLNIFVKDLEYKKKSKLSVRVDFRL